MGNRNIYVVYKSIYDNESVYNIVITPKAKPDLKAACDLVNQKRKENEPIVQETMLLDKRTRHNRSNAPKQFFIQQPPIQKNSQDSFFDDFKDLFEIFDFS